MDRLLMSKNGPAIAGLVLGVIAAFLVKFGNPGNMGFCVACFTRDIAGAFGLHRAAIVQYLRPEIAGFILGAFGSALAFSEYRPRGGSSPMVRFALGFFAMIGALVFLGCPWRAYLRLAGGDWNAIAGIAGLIVGIGIGVWFLYGGFSLGPSRPTPKAAGLVMPLFAAAKGRGARHAALRRRDTDSALRPPAARAEGNRPDIFLGERPGRCPRPDTDFARGGPNSRLARAAHALLHDRRCARPYHDKGLPSLQGHRGLHCRGIRDELRAGTVQARI